MDDRAGKIGNFVFVLLSVLCLGAAGAGAWMFGAGARFDRTHRSADAVVAMESDTDAHTGKKLRAVPRLHFTAENRDFDLPVPQGGDAKERGADINLFRVGNHVEVWYPVGDPQSATVGSGLAYATFGWLLVAVAALVALVGLLMFAAEFFPNGPVRFG